MIYRFISGHYQNFSKEGFKGDVRCKGALRTERSHCTTAKSRGIFRLLVIALGLLIAEDSSVSAGSRALPQAHSAPVAYGAPVQSLLRQKRDYSKAGHQLTAVAEFKVKAKVLSVALYRKGREALFSPVDLALGWGKMASDQLLSEVKVTQSGRFASMSYDPGSDIAVNDIIHNSSNVHVIPASHGVKKQLQKIKKGQTVEIEGYLVNISHSDGWRWQTSMSRHDRGNGACEILLVTSVRIIG